MDIDQMLERVRKLDEWKDVDAAELSSAFRHPKARAEIEEILRREASTVGEGMPAPDFDLARLDGSGRVRLSSHIGVRPVALVFGSYT